MFVQYLLIYCFLSIESNRFKANELLLYNFTTYTVKHRTQMTYID